jgi:hypothetical protein
MTEHYTAALARGNEYLPDSQAVRAISQSNFKAYLAPTPQKDYLRGIGLSDTIDRITTTTVPFEMQNKGLNMRQYGIPGLKQEMQRYDLR